MDYLQNQDRNLNASSWFERTRNFYRGEGKWDEGEEKPMKDVLSNPLPRREARGHSGSQWGTDPTKEGAGVFIRQCPTTRRLEAAPSGCQFSRVLILPRGQPKQSLPAREHLPEAGGWPCVLKQRGWRDIIEQRLLQPPQITIGKLTGQVIFCLNYLFFSPLSIYVPRYIAHLTVNLN